MSLRHKSSIALIGAVFVVAASAWLWFSVAPKHWLGRVDFGAVKLDDRDVAADIFFGNPNQSEAESVALIHVKDGDDYFFDFASEKVRKASSSEYLRLFGGVWSYKSIPSGKFSEPLPNRNVNELRIATTNGHILSVQF